MTNPLQLRSASDWDIKVSFAVELAAVFGVGYGTWYFFSPTLRYAATLNCVSGSVGAQLNAQAVRQARGQAEPAPTPGSQVRRRRGLAQNQIQSMLSASQSSVRIIRPFCTNDMRGGRFRSFSVGAGAGVGASGEEFRLYDNNGSHVATISTGSVGVVLGANVNLGRLRGGLLANHNDAPTPVMKNPALATAPRRT